MVGKIVYSTPLLLKVFYFENIFYTSLETEIQMKNQNAPNILSKYNVKRNLLSFLVYIEIE